MPARDLMPRGLISKIAMLTAIACLPTAGKAQHDHAVTLHVSTRWKDCAFQIHPSLTQRAWRQFTREAGLVTYFRPLADARPMGAGRWEMSILQWETAIDDTDPAWNDTFVHPDSTHWLHDGSGLRFPALMLRAGVTDRVDVGATFSRNPNANYGSFGGQVQYTIAQDADAGWAAAARVSLVSLFGPDDLDLTVHGADLVASRRYAARWASLSPYAGVSAYLATSHEKTAAVALADERVTGARAMLGVVGEISVARIGVEYTAASVRSVSVKVGIAF